MRAYILVGTQGVGKSTWVSKNKGNCSVISKDEIRKEIGGSLDGFYERQDGLEPVLNKEFSKRFNSLVGDGTDLIVDNMNVSRKTRIGLYQQLKNKGYEVIIVWFHQPFSVALERNNQRSGCAKVSEDVLRDTYKRVDIPKVLVDCDAIKFECAPFSDYKDEINAHIKESHDSPYHAESIMEHIQLTIQNAGNDEDLKEIARFHDLGKSFCKQYDNSNRRDKEYFRSINNGKYATYLRHENVSACYYLAYMYEQNKLSQRNWDILEAIRIHMQAHSKISDKTINHNKLSDDVVSLAYRFAEVDSKSKISDEELDIKMAELRDGIKPINYDELINNPNLLVIGRKTDRGVNVEVVDANSKIDGLHSRLMHSSEIKKYEKLNSKLSKDELKAWVKERIDGQVSLNYEIGLAKGYQGSLLGYYQAVNDELERNGLSIWYKINYNAILDLYTVSYLHGGVNFTDERARMARGLTLDKDGKIILRGFNKFFNYQQLEGYDRYSDSFKDEFSRVKFIEGKGYAFYEKLDGSLMILGAYKNKLLVSTTSSIDNEIAVYGSRYFNGRTDSKEIYQYLDERNLCACFEWIGPNNRVVVEYDEEDFISLALVNKETGKQHQLDRVHQEFAQKFGLTIPKKVIYTYEEIAKIMKEDVDIEGFVLRNHKGNLIKFKTDEWFKKSNRFSIFYSGLTQATVRTLVEAYIEDDIDDLLSYKGDAHVLINKVVEPLKQLEREVLAVVNNYPKPYTKDTLISISKLDIETNIKSGVFSYINTGEILTHKQVPRLVNYVLNYHQNKLTDRVLKLKFTHDNSMNLSRMVQSKLSKKGSESKSDNNKDECLLIGLTEGGKVTTRIGMSKRRYTIETINTTNHYRVAIPLLLCFKEDGKVKPLYQLEELLYEFVNKMIQFYQNKVQDINYKEV